MTISTPGGTRHLFFLKTSRTSLRDRFRSTDLPALRVTVMPRRDVSCWFEITKAVKYLAWYFLPPSYVRRKFSRLRILSDLGKPSLVFPCGSAMGRCLSYCLRAARVQLI